MSNTFWQIELVAQEREFDEDLDTTKNYISTKFNSAEEIYLAIRFLKNFTNFIDKFMNDENGL